MVPADERNDPIPRSGADRPDSARAPLRPVRDRILDALLELAAEREWEDFGIADVAGRAGVSLADFRDAFPSKGAVLAAFSKGVDRKVLEGTGETLADETPRERLFDVLMRRLDVLAPHRLALQSIVEWVRRDPLSAAAINGVALNSMRFMLAAAGIETEGPAGAIKVQGLVLAWGRVLDTWLEDEEPGLARTMATLDKELARGETWAGRVDDLDRLLSPVRLLARAMADGRRRRRPVPRQRSATLDDADPDVIV